MHNDETQPPAGPPPGPDAEIEARVVAWVLGEASAFEIAELERLVAARPELAIFKRRLEAVHGLVGEAARPEPAALRLAPGRREKLLATIGAGASEGEITPEHAAAAATPLSLPLLGARGKGRRVPAWAGIAIAAAACVTVGLFVMQERTLSFEKEQRAVAMKREGEAKVMANEKRWFEQDAEEKQKGAVGAAGGDTASTMAIQMPALEPRSADDLAGVRQQLVASAPTPSAPLNIFGLGSFEAPKGIVLTDSANSFGPVTATASKPTTATDRSALVWSGGNFNIAPAEVYNFQSPIGGAVLDKVGYGTSGADTATVPGSPGSGGKVFVLADGSIHVGGDANINTQGTFLSTISDTSDFAFTTGGSLGFSGASQSPSSRQVATGSRGTWSGSSTLNNVVSLNGDLIVNTRSTSDSGLNLAGTGGPTVMDGNLAVINRDGVIAQGRTLTVGGAAVGAGLAPTGVNLTAENKTVAITESNTLNLRDVTMPAGGNGTLTFSRLNGAIIDTGLGGVKAAPGAAREGQSPNVVTLAATYGSISIAPQTQPVPSDIVKLDAFVVNESPTTGFAAASTLSASRLPEPPPAFGDRLGGLSFSSAGTGTALPALRVPGTSRGKSAAGAADAPRSAGGGSDLAFLRGEADFATAPAAKLAAIAPAERDALTLSAFTVSTDAGKRARRAEPAKARVDEDKPVVRPAPARVVPPADAEVRAAQEATSTFSLHVGDVSFRLAQAALARGERPDPARIRPEEFYNALDYGDPAPGAAEKIACRIEQVAHPVLQQRNLVRIALKVGATGRGAQTPLRLTVLLDTSGSMEREDRAATVRRALASLASLLGPADRVTLIGFARTPRLLAEALPGEQAKSLARIAAGIPAEGGTNLEEALRLAGELARRHRLAGAQNRIVLLTDGAANLGNAVPAQLAAAIEGLRRDGIALDACGVGLDGLDDEILEALTRHGDGRYTVLNAPEDADADFARTLAGAFRPAAENVKLQVRFNPARVGAWRLIGFEQHRMKAEDFRNDAVDAAELAAEEAAVALYQIEPLPQGEGEIGEVFVRFRDPAGGGMVERSWSIPHEARAPGFARASQSMRLAGVAALLAEKLRGGTLAGQFKLGELAPAVAVLRSHYANIPRVEELTTMFDRARSLLRE